MIAANKHHGPVDDEPAIRADRKMWNQMPAEYKARLHQVLKTRGGKAALARYRKFTGLPFPTEIVVKELPGAKSRKTVLVGMGKSPGPQLESGRKVRGMTSRLPWYVATDARGKRIMLIPAKGNVTGRASVRRAGKVAETHYVLTPAEESAGTFKRYKYWVHKHNDEGGKHPEGYWVKGSNGRKMFVYAPGTYSVGKWIRRN